MKLPAFQFYPGDWMKDPDLRICSIFARGLLVDLLCMMFEAKRRGVLEKQSGEAWTSRDVHRAVGSGAALQEIEAAIKELEDAGVLKREKSTGCLYSSRMIRDESIREKRTKSGSKGGSKTQANRVAKGQAKTGSSSSSSSSSSDKEKSPNGDKKKTAFSPPSVSEVHEHCEAKGYNFDPEQFVAFYESKGWRVGNQPMKSWKSACVTWNGRDRPKTNSNGSGGNEDWRRDL